MVIEKVSVPKWNVMVVEGNVLIADVRNISERQSTSPIPGSVQASQ